MSDIRKTLSRVIEVSDHEIAEVYDYFKSHLANTKTVETQRKALISRFRKYADQFSMRDREGIDAKTVDIVGIEVKTELTLKNAKFEPRFYTQVLYVHLESIVGKYTNKRWTFRFAPNVIRI